MMRADDKSVSVRPMLFWFARDLFGKPIRFSGSRAEQVHAIGQGRRTISP